MADTTLLIEIDLTSPAAAAVTLRISDRSIRPFPPGDPDRPNAVFAARIVDPPSLRRMLFEDLSNLTPSIGYGSLTLANGDHGLDVYQGYAWGEIRVTRWTVGTSFASSAMILKGLVLQPTFTVSSDQASRVTVPIYDYRLELTALIQTSNFRGTNGVGGVLYDGSPDGLKGKPLPIMIGRLDDAHLQAPQVNAGLLAYQLQDGSISGPVSIFDRGAPAGFAYEGDLGSTAFDAHTPAAASYCTDLSRSLLKINGSPVGTLTFGARSGAGTETSGQILYRLLQRSGVPPARIGASVSSAGGSAQVGGFWDEPTSGQNAVGWVAASSALALAPDRAGVWQATALAGPAGSPDASLTDLDVIKLQADDTAPGPVGDVRIGWGRIYTTFRSGDLAPSLRNTATAERLGSEYRYAVASDPTAKARFPRTVRTVQIDTALRVEADALTLAGALRDLFGLKPDGTPRRFWKVTIALTDARLALPLGATIRLDYSPAALAQSYVLVGEEPMRPRRDQVVWTLWG